MRRLYLQIYLAFVAIVGLGLLVAAAAWKLGGLGRHDAVFLRSLSSVAGDLLPAASDRGGETAVVVQRLSRRLALSVALHAPDGTLIARQQDAAGSAAPATATPAPSTTTR